MCAYPQSIYYLTVMIVICSKRNWNIFQIKIENFTKSSNGIGFFPTKFIPFKLHRNCSFIRYFLYCKSLSKYFFPIFFFFFTLAPSTIIYDNCCNLHVYCLFRDPHFCKDTLLLIGFTVRPSSVIFAFSEHLLSRMSKIKKFSGHKL